MHGFSTPLESEIGWYANIIYPTYVWLVVWNMAFIFPYIGNVIIATDFHSIIFQRGRSSTNQMLCGYGSIPIDTFLVGWTSIYQLFWCSPGLQGFDTLPCGDNQSIFIALHFYPWVFWGFHYGMKGHWHHKPLDPGTLSEGDNCQQQNKQASTTKRSEPGYTLW